ncbi:MAG: phosphate propanoyltransferase [Peptostreptococcales bacterium]|jgi:putative phosphotransacetylase
MSNFKVPIGLSNKHLHLSQEHIDVLFGKNYELTRTKDLSQPGQFACEEKVDILGPKGTLKGIRVLGPARPETQIEISLADARALGLKVPVRDSGDIEGTPGAKIVGPKGEVELDKGVIVAGRHIHMHTKDGEASGYKDKDIVCVQVDGKRGLIFNNVLIRVGDCYSLEMHLDIEEGNAAMLDNGDIVEIIG